MHNVTRGLEPLVRPRSVAIVGASADVRRTAGKPAVYLKKHGFPGRVCLVNPRYSEITGLPCVPRVADLPEVPDVGLVLLGAEAAIEAVRQLAELGVPAAIVLAGGFAEIDATGAQRQARLLDAAGDMRLLGPNTIGMVNVADQTALSASGALELERLAPGRVAIVSQSGGMLGALLSRGASRGMGFSRLISTGNEADVDVCDAIEYLLDDDATRVIGLYLESVRRPGRFRELAGRAAERGKPLVVFKIGRSEAGAQSATSHTGAVAGTDRMYDALFKQTGAVRVETLDGLLDAAAGLVFDRQLRGRRLGILTSTGGGGSLVAEACGLRGFEVPAPDAATSERLRAALSGESAMADRNPIDLTLANLRSETYRETVSALVESASYDAVVVVVGSSGLEDPSLAAAPVRDASLASEKPVVVYVNPSAMNIVSYLNGVGVPAFFTAEGCATALAALADASGGTPPVASAGTRLVRGARAAGDAGRARVRMLNEAEALGLFADHGVAAAAHVVARTPREAAALSRSLAGKRLVVKILSGSVAHKSDVGGVRVGVAPRDVEAVCEEVRERVGAERVDGWLVQEQVSGGTELLLGVIRDAQLGLAVVLGAGGIATEVFGDRTVRLLPLGPSDARAMLGELKCRVLLEGFRGQPPGDVDALAAAIEHFGQMALALGERLLEAEINPLFVLPRGGGVVAADGLVVLAEEPALATDTSASETPNLQTSTEARRGDSGSKLAAT
jgi:acyl-CoA synthetase (NDP forming)